MREDGNYYIRIGFRTEEQRDNAIAEGLVPSSLDGVDVVVDEVCGQILPTLG